jgi:hypothetical protein
MVCARAGAAEAMAAAMMATAAKAVFARGELKEELWSDGRCKALLANRILMMQPCPCVGPHSSMRSAEQTRELAPGSGPMRKSNPARAMEPLPAIAIDWLKSGR